MIGMKNEIKFRKEWVKLLFLRYEKISIQFDNQNLYDKVYAILQVVSKKSILPQANALYASTGDVNIKVPQNRNLDDTSRTVLTSYKAFLSTNLSHRLNNARIWFSTGVYMARIVQFRTYQNI